VGLCQVFFDYADIGFAAATPKGLVVPVLRNVESMGLKGVLSSCAHCLHRDEWDVCGRD
jgi:pyruvate/2-oxoglutarate dehydrogenase complex dihydrolipoamide acyltransferase (E2) component